MCLCNQSIASELVPNSNEHCRARKYVYAAGRAAEARQTLLRHCAQCPPVQRDCCYYSTVPELVRVKQGIKEATGSHDFWKVEGVEDEAY